MSANVEEEYTDVLQNIEYAIVSVFRRDPLLVDFDVENAISGLTSYYKARAQNHEPRLPNLNERGRLVYDRVKAVCEWRLGNEAAPGAGVEALGPQPVPVSMDVIVACLKRIRKSVQTWNKEGGRQGYLTFIQQFIR